VVAQQAVGAEVGDDVFAVSDRGRCGGGAFGLVVRVGWTCRGLGAPRLLSLRGGVGGGGKMCIFDGGGEGGVARAPTRGGGGWGRRGRAGPGRSISRFCRGPAESVASGHRRRRNRWARGTAATSTARRPGLRGRTRSSPGLRKSTSWEVPRTVNGLRNIL